jgi:hypothetical protein
MTGSASITSKTWRHESDPLEGEKQGAPQIVLTMNQFMALLLTAMSGV